MICAWIETSSAVVGSSAMISSGSAQSASASTTRWRIPPENSCGIGIDALFRALDADLGQQRDGARAGRTFVKREMRADGLDDLVADAIERVEAGQRVLEDHADALSPDRPHLLAREIVDALAP